MENNINIYKVNINIVKTPSYGFNTMRQIHLTFRDLYTAKEYVRQKVMPMLYTKNEAKRGWRADEPLTPLNLHIQPQRGLNVEFEEISPTFWNINLIYRCKGEHGKHTFTFGIIRREIIPLNDMNTDFKAEINKALD